MPGCGQRLGINVDTHHAFGAQQQRGDGKNAAATAIVNHRLTGQILCIQPSQTQGRGGVCAGAKGQAWVERHDHRIALRGNLGALFLGRDPQPAPEAQRLPVHQPGTNPVLIFKQLGFEPQISTIRHQRAQGVLHFIDRDGGVEQAKHHSVCP